MVTPMKKIRVQKPNREACAYLFKTKEEYVEWATSPTPEQVNCRVKLRALHGTEFMVDGVYVNTNTALWYAVRHYDTPRTHFMPAVSRMVGAYTAIYYTTWVIPEPYFAAVK